MAQPDFFLDLTVFERRCVARVNGIPVLHSLSGHRLEVRIPVNHLMTPGVNSLEWIILPERGDYVAEHVGAQAELLYAPMPGAAPSPVTQIAHYGPMPEAPLDDSEGAGPTTLGTAGNKQVWRDPDTGFFRIRRQVSVDLPLPQWVWTRSGTIPDNADTRDSLLAFYQALHELLLQGDRDRLIALHEEKCAELQVAYGMDRDTILDEIALPFAHEDPRWTLQTPDWSAARLNLAAEGRLARLIDPAIGPLIHYRDAAGLWRSFELWLRIEGGQWVIAR